MKESSQIPIIADLLDKISQAKVFSKLDLASGYWQLSVDQSSRKYLRFETDKQQYQFKVMPFGITNAPSIFQKIMTNILKDIEGVVVLIDDIIVFSEDRTSNIKILKKVLKRLKENNLKVKKSKCFFKEELKLFGYLIKDGKILLIQIK